MRSNFQMIDKGGVKGEESADPGHELAGTSDPRT
jgi:hypothetical protein